MNAVSGVLLLFSGISSGILVAAGVFTFINSLGIVTRLAQITKTADKLSCYESWICFGAVSGNLAWLAMDGSLCSGKIKFWNHGAACILSNGGLICFGLFAGIFTGCLVGAIAEILDAFPIMFRRIQLAEGTAMIILALAAGKFTGIILQFFLSFK